MNDKLLCDRVMDWLDQNRNDIVFRQWHMHILDGLTQNGTQFLERFDIVKPQPLMKIDCTVLPAPPMTVELINYHLLDLRLRDGLIYPDTIETLACAVFELIPRRPDTPERFYLSRIYSELKDGIIYWRAYWAHCNSVNERSDRP